MSTSAQALLFDKYKCVVLFLRFLLPPPPPIPTVIICLRVLFTWHKQLQHVSHRATWGKLPPNLNPSWQTSTIAQRTLRPPSCTSTWQWSSLMNCGARRESTTSSCDVFVCRTNGSGYYSKINRMDACACAHTFLHIAARSWRNIFESGSVVKSRTSVVGFASRLWGSNYWRNDFNPSLGYSIMFYWLSISLIFVVVFFGLVYFNFNVLV